MTSPWLRNYVLQELGSEIRKEGGLLPLPQQEQEQEWQKHKLGQQQQKQKQKSSTTRLVRIIARGQGGLIERGNDGVYVEGGNNWWTVHRRGISPNLEMNTNAWLWVSDGSSSIKVKLSIQSLRQIYDCDNENNNIIGNNDNSNSNSNINNNDCFFGRGCCILLKKYSVEFDPFHLASSSSSNNNNNGNSNYINDDVDLVTVLANINNFDMKRYPVQLKVSSLEAKPSLNNHTMTNNTIILPVLEDIDVLYAVQYLTRQQQIQQQGNDDKNNYSSSSSSKRKRNIARDWDIAFGHLSKGSFVATISTNDGDDTSDTDTAAVDNASPGRNKNTNIDGTTTTVRRTLQQITYLVEKAGTTDEAIQAWELAKNDYGIGSGGGGGCDSNDIGDGTFNNSMSKAMTITTNKNYNTTATNLPDRYDDDVDEEEDHSRMYIQNVLATQEDEDNDENDEEDEEPLLLETQLESKGTTATASIATPYIPPHINAKSILDNRPSVTEIAKIKQRSNNESTDNGDIHEAVGIDLTTTTRYKRQQANGTDSPSILKSAKQYLQKHQSMQEKEEEEEKEELTNSIWESVKEQCIDETRPFLHFVPSWRMASNNNDVPTTPKERIISPTINDNNNYTNTDTVSVGSIDANFTISSPSPSSGAYYKKYGLARWLKKNTVDIKNNNNDDGFVNYRQNLN